MRRVVCLFLSVVMLFSFFPDRVVARSYVRDIDVVFGGFQLKVNNKKVVNHKEPFIYGDDLFVGLTDLARGLEMEVNVSGDTAQLSSKGKLSFDSNSSKESLVFQRGYEIMTKERLKDNLEDEIYMLSNPSSSYIDYKIKARVKTIKVGFGVISVYLDGKKLNLDGQLLKYNNDIYIPLDSIAPYLYITPSMTRDKTTINIDANGILIKNNLYPTATALLNFREGRNYLLDLQRAELEKKKSFMEEFKIPYKKISNIKTLEKYLNDNFSKVGDLDLRFSLVQQSNWINLDISFPAAKNSLWYRLKRSNVESMVWNVYTAIINLYDDEALISGAVRNPYYNSSSNSALKNYVTFYTKDKDIYFDFSKSRLGLDDGVNPGYLMEILNINLPNYSNVNFTYDANMSGHNIELIVRADSKNFNNLSIYTKMGYLKLLKEKIRNLYPDIVVDGKMVFPDENILPLNFYINENRIRSFDLMAETIRYLNAQYGRFSYGADDFVLNYSLYEKDFKDFNLIAIGDFLVTDDKWVDAGIPGETLLSNRIHNALSFVISLWDANVSTEVVDREGNVIKEFDIYQENVSLVSADPPSGEIVEGTRVMLFTDTPGAKIFYTIDGSTPTIYSDLYSGTGIEVTRNMDINAFGHKDGLGSGPVSTFKYTVVKDQGLSDGLNGLAIHPGTLTPNFAQNNHLYTVFADANVETIRITPSASKGVVKVNGSIVNSGQSREITLNSGATNITIGVKEEGKRERVYTIVVNKDSSGLNVFDVVDLKFNTLFGLIFSGRVVNNSVDDFSGYKIEILSKSDEVKGFVQISGDGEFSFPNIPLTAIDKIIGFKFRVYDSGGKMVLERNLN